MTPPTMVTLTIPLTIPLALANALEAQAIRQQISIPEMLSNHLIEAEEERDDREREQAALDQVNGMEFDAESFTKQVHQARTLTIEPPASPS